MQKRLFITDAPMIIVPVDDVDWYIAHANGNHLRCSIMHILDNALDIYSGEIIDMLVHIITEHSNDVDLIIVDDAGWVGVYSNDTKQYKAVSSKTLYDEWTGSAVVFGITTSNYVFAARAFNPKEWEIVKTDYETLMNISRSAWDWFKFNTFSNGYDRMLDLEDSIQTSIYDKEDGA